MFKIYILLFMVVSTFTYALNISANNPAAIRQIVVAQDQIKLSLQVISDNFSQPRCMCPEATFFNDVKNNNGKFDVYVDKDWLQNSFPDLLQDKNYLSNLYL
ncbi:hypothetical protein MJH12_09415 [bacterium]|nr:hypothetical protein [bacterium]